MRDGVAEVETVSVRTDRELAAFVTRLLRLVENPRRRDDLRTGRLRFRLAPGGAAGAPASARPAHRIDKGAVTEAAVRDAARAGARLVLGRRAVLTPLARDRARAAGRRDREGALMVTATVVGNVWATRRLAEIPKGAFLEVEADGSGQRFVAFDVLGSGVGERVLVVQGSVAAAWFPGEPPPVDALIIGSVDPGSSTAE